MELHQLCYLVAIAETGNFTRAAERSHITQPSLSQQVINLEKEVGHKLFHRLGRKAVLTEAGDLSGASPPHPIRGGERGQGTPGPPGS